jgi:hypothetical protein
MRELPDWELRFIEKIFASLAADRNSRKKPHA